MKFLFLEPFYGGSHRNFAEGWVSSSRHDIELMTMPARFWKWRMRGAAMYFAARIKTVKHYDGIIITDLMSLPDFKALLAGECPPCMVYFHESQLTYPLSPGEQMDYQYGFTNIATALAAQRVMFNSRYHLESFLSALPGFLAMMPDCRPTWIVQALRDKAGVLYPGCCFPAGRLQIPPPDVQPPLIIWNHRWEFDKNPSDFFRVVDALVDQGMDFQIALLGEQFRSVPNEFQEARHRYKGRIVQYGYVASPQDYIQWLKKGTAVISTAFQENFGISVIEAVRFGCMPLLPNRLSYPELIPEMYHKYVLYERHEDLLHKLMEVLTSRDRFLQIRSELSDAMERFSWDHAIRRYDDLLEDMASDN